MSDAFTPLTFVDEVCSLTWDLSDVSGSCGVYAIIMVLTVPVVLSIFKFFVYFNVQYYMSVDGWVLLYALSIL